MRSASQNVLWLTTCTKGTCQTILTHTCPLPSGTLPNSSLVAQAQTIPALRPERPLEFKSVCQPPDARANSCVNKTREKFSPGRRDSLEVPELHSNVPQINSSPIVPNQHCRSLSVEVRSKKAVRSFEGCNRPIPGSLRKRR